MKTPRGHAGGAEAPLLPWQDQPGPTEPSASVSGAVFNLSTSIIGAGIMSIPATLKVLGVGPAIGLILVVAILCDVSVEFLLRYTYSGKVMSYAGIMAESFGRAGATGLQLSVILTNLGALIMYLIIIGDVLSGNKSEGEIHLGLLQEWFGVHWWNSRPVALLFILVFVLLPLLLFRRLGLLSLSLSLSLSLFFFFLSLSLSLFLSLLPCLSLSISSLSLSLFLSLLPSLSLSLALSLPLSLFSISLSLSSLYFFSLSVLFLSLSRSLSPPYSLSLSLSLSSLLSLSLISLSPISVLFLSLSPISRSLSLSFYLSSLSSFSLSPLSPSLFISPSLCPLSLYLLSLPLFSLSSIRSLSLSISKQARVNLLLFLLQIIVYLHTMKSQDSLRFSSAVSVFLAVVFVAVSSAMALYALFKGSTKTPRLLPDLSSGTSFYELFTAVPVLVLAFTFHFNVHPIRAELQRSADMTKAVRLSLILCSAIYAAVGLSGYLLFGDATMADILSNFDRTSSSVISPLINDLVRLSYGLHLVLVFPLLNFSLRINMDGLFFPRSPPLPYDQTRFVSLTVGLAAFVYLAAIAIPNIWTLFQLFGSTSAVCLSLIFPAAIVLRDIHGIASKRDKVVAATMIVLAAATSAVAVSSDVVGIFKSKQ